MPSASRFEPHSQRYGLFLVWGCLQPNFIDFEALGPFWARFLDILWSQSAPQGFSTRANQVALTVECMNCFPSFGCFQKDLGPFGAKNGFFWPKMTQIWGAPPNLVPAPCGAISDFQAQNLDSATPPPRL